MKLENVVAKISTIIIANIMIFGLFVPYLISADANELVILGVLLVLVTIWADIKITRNFVEKHLEGDEQ